MLEARKTPAEPPSRVAIWVAGPPHISIDSNGNLTSKTEGTTTWTYEWNAENQLTRVLSNGSEVARYKYDPVGRRVEKVAGATTTAWAYDAEDVLREATGATSWRYVHGAGIDEPLAKEDSGGVLVYFHVDGLGSVNRTTTSAGGVATTYSYDAFGTMTGGAGGYGYTGREWDPEAQLFYYRARYYDSRIGRFIGQDPIRFLGGVNFYAYVDGDPVGRTDPTGLWPTTPQDVRDDVRRWRNPYDPPNPGNNYVPRVPSDQWDTRNRLRHCLASCLITRYVIGGAFTAWVGGDVIQDPFFLPPGFPAHNDPGDRRANRIGRCVATGRPDLTCEEACIENYAQMYEPGEMFPR